MHHGQSSGSSRSDRGCACGPGQSLHQDFPFGRQPNAWWRARGAREAGLVVALAAAALVGKEKRDRNPAHRGDEEYNYFLAVIFPDNQLKILDYNRVIRDLNGQPSGADFSKKIVVRTNEDVIDLVASYYKITKSELISDDRRKEYNVPRQVCMYLIREILNQSYETIGESFSGRNHTTVMHAVNKIMKEITEADSRIRRDINALKKEIGV